MPTALWRGGGVTGGRGRRPGSVRVTGVVGGAVPAREAPGAAVLPTPEAPPGAARGRLPRSPDAPPGTCAAPRAAPRPRRGPPCDSAQNGRGTHAFRPLARVSTGLGHLSHLPNNWLTREVPRAPTARGGQGPAASRARARRGRAAVPAERPRFSAERTAAQKLLEPGISRPPCAGAVRPSGEGARVAAMLGGPCRPRCPLRPPHASWSRWVRASRCRPGGRGQEAAEAADLMPPRGRCPGPGRPPPDWELLAQARARRWAAFPSPVSPPGPPVALRTASNEQEAPAAGRGSTFPARCHGRPWGA